MTVEEIIGLLRSCGADAWEITQTTEETWEFYFIRRRLDQNRVRSVEHIRVKVYRKSPDGQYLGSAQGEIYPTSSPEEAEKNIRTLLRSASYVKNPVYTLRKPEESASDPENGPIPSPSSVAEDFIRAVNQVPESASEDINSWELFVTSGQRRFLNSEGIDKTENTTSSALEIVLNARDASHEIELYRMYQSGTCDAETLVRDITETLAIGKNKLTARPTPALRKADVLFSNAAVLPVYEYFTDRMNAAFIVQGISDWKKDDPIAQARYDTITVSAVKTLPNSSANHTFDPEGAPTRDLVLIERNIPKNFYGNRQFSEYLSLSDSFQAENFRFEGGSETEESIRKGDYLEVLEFSDFQVSPLNGDIAGEIRLALWHCGGEVIPVSGGSVSGTMTDFVRTMRMSRALRHSDNYVIPAFTRLQGVTVTGAEAE